STETSELVSASATSSTTAGNFDSDATVLSRDGSVVVFHSDATNLVAGDNNDKGDVFAFGPPAGPSLGAPPAPPPRPFIFGGNFPVGDAASSMTAADVNGDGRPDVIVTNSGSYTSLGSVTVLL